MKKTDIFDFKLLSEKLSGILRDCIFETLLEIDDIARFEVASYIS
jgi:hypothetical protein